jgi:hypothetical protein
LLFAGAAGAVIGGYWLRNILIIQEYPFLFTWDGMASTREGYGLLSSLIPQLHPDIRQATRELYLEVRPHLEWIRDTQGYRWGAMTFMAGGILSALLVRNGWLLLVVGVTMIHFTFFDSSLSTHFFRHYIAVFPGMFLAAAVLGARLGHRSFTKNPLRSMAVQIILTLGICISGSRYLMPQNLPPIEFWSVPEEALSDADHILMNSGMFQPESMIYRYPDRSFAGLPYHPEDLEAFLDTYPEYQSILWRELFSVQDPILKELTESGRAEFEEWYTVWNGLRYVRYTLTEKDAHSPRHP